VVESGPYFGGRLSRREFVKRGGAGLMGAMLLGVSGCGGNGASEKERANVEGAKTLVKGEGGGEEVVFWTPFTGPVDVASLTKIVKEFNEQSADATVTMIQVPGDETDVSKLMTAVRRGVRPDVYHLDRFTTSQRAADGVLQPLDQYMDPGLGDRYLKFAWDEVLYEEKPYALPFDTDVRALFYRRDMLQDVDIDPAELDAENRPISVDRLTDRHSDHLHTVPRAHGRPLRHLRQNRLGKHLSASDSAHVLREPVLDLPGTAVHDADTERDLRRSQGRRGQRVAGLLQDHPAAL
jgi:hypothetical protein